MPETVSKPFAARMSEVFKKTGQTAADFMVELKALNQTDRQWYADQLNKAGYPTLPPAQLASPLA